MGDKVKILDSGRAIARQVRRVLTNNDDLSLNKNPSYAFYSTGDAKELKTVAKKLVGAQVNDLINSVQAISL